MFTRRRDCLGALFLFYAFLMPRRRYAMLMPFRRFFTCHTPMMPLMLIIFLRRHAYATLIFIYTPFSRPSFHYFFISLYFH